MFTVILCGTSLQERYQNYYIGRIAIAESIRLALVFFPCSLLMVYKSWFSLHYMKEKVIMN
jgi:hypothetical protein